MLAVLTTMMVMDLFVLFTIIQTCSSLAHVHDSTASNATKTPPDLRQSGPKSFNEKDFGDIYIDDQPDPIGLTHDSGSGMTQEKTTKTTLVLNNTHPSLTFLDADDQLGYYDDSIGSGLPPRKPQSMTHEEGLTKCQILRDRALKGFQVFYTPQCKENGEFKPLQCKDDQCWCVDADGGIIPYTRQRVRDRPPVCADQKPYFVNEEARTVPGTVRTTPPPVSSPAPLVEEQTHGSPWFVVSADILAGIIVGTGLGVVSAALLVVFIIHRMKKKDEGSYVLDETRPAPPPQTYSRAPNKEFYA